MNTYPSTYGVSNKNPSVDEHFKKNEKGFSYQTNYSNMYKQLANPVFMNKLHYYDSPDQNGHIYPNMFHIKPVDFNEKQTNVGSFLMDSIQKSRKFLYGGQLHDVKRIDMWS
jgi:hypothetical protein